MMNKTTKKRQNKRKKMDYRRRMEFIKQVKKESNGPKEKLKKMTNENVKYPDYPQREDIPNFPLPTDVSFVLKNLESRFFNQIDEFYSVSRYEILTQTQYGLLGGGVINNMEKLQMTGEIWDNIKSFSDQIITTGKIRSSFNILVALNYRIHLETLRLITGKSLMDILYLGEINVQNDISDSNDMDFYNSVGSKIYEMLCSNHDLDLTTLSLKDISVKQDLTGGQICNS